MYGYQQCEKIQCTKVDRETLLYVSTDESSRTVLLLHCCPLHERSYDTNCPSTSNDSKPQFIGIYYL